MSFLCTLLSQVSCFYETARTLRIFQRLLRIFSERLLSLGVGLIGMVLVRVKDAYAHQLAFSAAHISSWSGVVGSGCQLK
jgi:hypothetical protein